jgi:hypothetical protein
MIWNLFLDDIRNLDNKKFLNNPWYKREWIIARSFAEACILIKEKGYPTNISFDHDLGSDKNGNELKNGYDLAKWLVNQELNGTYSFPKNFDFKVHSDNPVGLDNIIFYLDSYLKQK